MALNRAASTRFEKVQAFPALAMAVFEQTGLREMIDSRFDIDPRIKLTPGNAVKALIGNMFTSEGRRPLYNVSHPFMSAPVDLLFGPKVDVPALGGRAFDRNLDRLFELDLPGLSYDCYQRLCGFYGLSSNMFNIDSTNFTIHSLNNDADRDGAAVPGWCGHAKDGHNERMVYSLLSMTDGNGIVCYERPYDGSTSDQEMDRGAIEFLSGKVEPSETTLVADCKIATGPLVDMMCDLGFGFVAKCPDNFGNRIREDVVYSVASGTMDPSMVRDGWSVYDTDAEVDGRKLRFVAYRTPDDIEAGVEYHREQDLKEAEARFRRFGSRTFNCDIDARRAVDDALKGMVDNAYDVKWRVEPIEVNLGYGRRGRPGKGDSPRIVTEYRVDVELEFNEERAVALSQNRGVRVLVTNLPRSMQDEDNIRSGATADTVLKTYLGQSRIEHAFRIMKDGMSMDRVYLHRPSRENAMMFVISLATMMSDIIHHVLVSEGIDHTAEDLAGRMTTLTLVHNREQDEETLDGPEALQGLFIDCIEALGIDSDHIIH
ncbi:MAG: IS1634 family transposase [Candidatus Methanomethylophilaceae archaeon]|nr:IS1634 family transposase [Candidatus Methanomethylophilaceae archaeon]